jgi:hypothetical protein
VLSQRNHFPRGSQSRLPRPRRAIFIHFCHIAHDDLVGLGMNGQEEFLSEFRWPVPAHASSEMDKPFPVAKSETRHA